MTTNTKIIATIGPACSSKSDIAALVKAGVSVFRFNTKHNSLNWHSQRIRWLRQISKQLEMPVAVMLVLRGPELRVGEFPGGAIELNVGEKVCLTSAKQTGRIKKIMVADLAVVKDLKVGQRIYLDDGFLELKITDIKPGRQEILTEVIEGGQLKSRKSINFPQAEIDLPSLTAVDLQFINLKENTEVDFFSYSFVRSRKDILALKQVLVKKGLQAKVIAKIENRAAIDNLEEILTAADALMVARGDLGVEIPLAEVPFYQKMIIQRCREQTKPVIVATQMLESMAVKPRPTRAETSDVANAVYDNADALMLSGETASGQFPLKAVQTMQAIAGFSEQKRLVSKIECQGRNLTEVIAFSGLKVLNNQYFAADKPRGFVVLTDTGLTARFLSSLRPAIPIFAVTDNQKVRNQLCLSYGVIPFYHQFPRGRIRSTKYVLQFLKRKKQLQAGDRVILIYGEQWGVPGGTNTIRVAKIQ